MVFRIEKVGMCPNWNESHSVTKGNIEVTATLYVAR
jgi:hypothetical protein